MAIAVKLNYGRRITEVKKYIKEHGEDSMLTVYFRIINGHQFIDFIGELSKNSSLFCEWDRNIMIREMKNSEVLCWLKEYNQLGVLL